MPSSFPENDEDYNCIGGAAGGETNGVGNQAGWPMMAVPPPLEEGFKEIMNRVTRPTAILFTKFPMKNEVCSRMVGFG